MAIDELESPLESSARRSIKKLLLPLFLQVGTTAQSLRADSVGFWHVGEERYWLPRFVFRGAKETGEETIRLAIFAGLHGDEPAGVHALVDLLRALEADPWVGRAYRIHLYPLCNPTGYEDGTRHARSGVDLNREFWRGSLEPEVGIIERELLQHKFHGIISLHSDDTSDGLYGDPMRGHADAASPQAGPSRCRGGPAGEPGGDHRWILRRRRHHPHGVRWNSHGAAGKLAGAV